MVFFGALDGIKNNCIIEGHKSTVMTNRECEQI